jgi:hypothetical protein
MLGPVGVCVFHPLERLGELGALTGEHPLEAEEVLGAQEQSAIRARAPHELEGAGERALRSVMTHRSLATLRSRPHHRQAEALGPRPACRHLT